MVRPLELDGVVADGHVAEIRARAVGGDERQRVRLVVGDGEARLARRMPAPSGPATGCSRRKLTPPQPAISAHKGKSGAFIDASYH